MSIAAINCSVLATAEEVSMIEAEIMQIDVEIQSLAFHTGELQSDFQAKLSAKQIAMKDLDSNSQEYQDLELDWEMFKEDYNTAAGLLEAQEKVMQMEKTNLQTKKEALTTMQESQEKRLNKNVEADFKGFN